MSTPLARRLAMDILRRTLDHGQDVQAAVNEVLRLAPVGPDKGLATELAYGYLRLRGRINFLLDQLLKNPAQTSQVLRRILGVAAYELLYLSRIPEYATLDWAVSLTKDRMDHSVGKVANAVLRNLVRLGRAVHQPEYYRTKTAGEAAYLAAWYSAPRWLCAMWLDAYGQDVTETFLEASLQSPPVAYRINRNHHRSAQLRDEPALVRHSVTPWGILAEQGHPDVDDLAAEGAMTRQSAAAQCLLHELRAERWPAPILDACAGRGGKTYLLAESGREVWASDINVFRLRQLQQEGFRLKLSVPIFRAPAQGPFPLRQAPRTIFLDAPCSGLGVLARRPDIKWKRTPQDCAQLAQLQQDMLRGAATFLPDGGCLIYMTCTLNPEENEKAIARFLNEQPRFSCLHQTQSKPEERLGEFFFGAVLHKAATSATRGGRAEAGNPPS